MNFVIGILTFLLVLNSGLLILLVLVQLPKKDTEAGAITPGFWNIAGGVAAIRSRPNPGRTSVLLSQ